ncbi:TOMM system kinase/cyclase fusion protein [Chitinophaga sp. YR573]|uniref:TOMM system kinase/cyclase fusion protein n=1 Tax=Chitinophaga sp. YR573 TaxID=1881040 RepID=UPI0008AABEE1|nr:TOMM system kinase/cyclase fusion protein [Chitinophaga sp. YR573]SEV95562.1 TOMM system kinase/cyclase fusion protein [Chitinophaga sp. YR573]
MMPEFPHLNNYRILEILGEGTFGQVYKAIQITTNQYVAIKMLKCDLLKGKQQIARFEREVQICAEISHPYIVKLLDKGYTSDDIPFVVFEYISGVTLKKLLLQEGAMRIHDAKELMGQVLDALSCAHDKGIVHRDLKPENIMVTKTGTRAYVKILDFGIGAFIQDAILNHETAGTPAYAAPEQLRGEPPTTRSDLYAWGLLLIECITGKPAIRGKSVADIYYQQLSNTVIAIPSFMLGHPLQDLLLRVLDKKVTTRIADAHILFHDYNHIDFTTLAVNKSEDNHPGFSGNDTMDNALAWNYERREKRQITVLCIKVNIQVTEDAGTDEETLEEIQRDQITTCTDIALRFGGYVKGIFADHIMIYFGYPHNSDSDARLASRTALEILARIQQRSTRFYKQLRIYLDIRLAIHSGMIISRQHKVPDGITANIALNLLSHTFSQRILITDAARQLLEPYVEFEKYKNMQFPDMLYEMETFHILRERSVEAFSQLKSAAVNRKMHGRDEVLATIIRHYEKVDSVNGQVILVRGEAGIGKSKLLYETKKAIKTNALIELRCLPEYRNIALQPLLEIIRQYYGLHTSTENSVSLLEQMLSGAGCEVNSALPVLLSWLDIPFTEQYPASQASPFEQKTILFNALKKCIVKIAEARKYVLIIEDLHWLDPSSRELLSEMITGTDKNNFLFLFSARPEFIPEWTDHSFSLIQLEPLDKVMSKGIIEELLGNKTIGQQSLGYIVNHTDGIPFFIEELTMMLMTKGRLVLENDVYTLTDNNLQLPVPATLRELLNARLDDMVLAKETAQLAATIGREFQYQLLMQISVREEESVQADLEELVNADIIYPLRTEKGLVYVFRHALFCEVTYSSQVTVARIQVHGRIAEVLINDNTPVNAYEAERLAWHLHGADRTASAVDWLLKGMNLLVKTSANRECMALCQQALKWVYELPETSERNNTEFSIRQLLLSNLIVVESFGSDAVLRQLDIMHKLQNDMDVQESFFPSMFLYSTYYAMRGDWKMATQIARQLYQQAAGLNNRKFIIVSSVFLGLQLFNDAKFVEGAAILEEALALYDPVHDDHLAYEFGLDQEVLGAGTLASMYVFLGREKEVPLLEKRITEKAARLNHPHTSASMYLGLSCVYFYLGNKAEVEKFSAALLQLNEQTDLNMFGHYAAILHAWSLDDLAGAMKALEEETASGIQSMRSFWHTIIAGMEIEAGYYESATGRLLNCLSYLGNSDGALYSAEIYRLLGTVCLVKQEYDTAFKYLNTAEEIAYEQHAVLIQNSITALIVKTENNIL